MGRPIQRVEANSGQSSGFASGLFRGRRSPAPGKWRRSVRVGAVRLGELAVQHADHHLCLPGLFRDRDHRRPGQGPGDLGLCHRRERIGRCPAEPAAGRHRRCRRAPQAVDRGLRACQHRCHGAAVVRRACYRVGAARSGVHGDRQCRRRPRNDVQQRPAAGHRNQGTTGPALRVGLGIGIYRWSGGAGRGAGRVRPTRDSAVRARPRTRRACPHHRASGGCLARSVRLAALRLHARSAGPQSRLRGRHPRGAGQLARHSQAPEDEFARCRSSFLQICCTRTA